MTAAKMNPMEEARRIWVHVGFVIELLSYSEGEDPARYLIKCHVEDDDEEQWRGEGGDEAILFPMVQLILNVVFLHSHHPKNAEKREG